MDKIITDEDLGQAINEAGVKLSDLIVSKDNMLDIIVFGAKTLMTAYSDFEEDVEKLELFKNNLVDIIKLSQDLGSISLMIDVTLANLEETEHE